MLKPGGILALATPNFSSIQAQFFKHSWFHLDLPRHLFHFGKNQLQQALIENGLIIKTIKTFSFEQNIFGNIQSTFNLLRFLGKPNSFYQFLKQQNGPRNTLSLVLWSLAATLIFPLALFETIVSSAMGKGASIIIFAQKHQ